MEPAIERREESRRQRLRGLREIARQELDEVARAAAAVDLPENNAGRRPLPSCAACQSTRRACQGLDCLYAIPSLQPSDCTKRAHWEMVQEIFGANYATKHLRNASAVEINGIVHDMREACMKSLIYEARRRLVEPR